MDRIKIHNLRVGFATNSSSSHSVVLLPPELVGTVDAIEPQSEHFGWDYFRLTSTEDKMRYVAAQMLSSMYEDAKEARQEIANKFSEFPNLAEELRNDAEEQWPNITVDHQSRWRVNPESFDNLIEFFKSPRIVILGGNDNSDYDTNHVPDAEPLEFVEALANGGASFGYRIRRDGQYWTAFDTSTGAKMRLSLDVDAEPYVKAKAPELVDLKITNYCDKGCEFCYQSSTVKGKHAELSTIKKHIDILAESDVFEIALGGGEPTDHPDFLSILSYIYNARMVVNFTTLSDKWLNDAALVEFITENVGGIGVSCQSAKDLDLVRKIKEAVTPANRWARSPVVTAQHVIGSVPLADTSEFINAAFAEKIPLLLLGYKEVGFGKKYERHDTNSDVPLFLRMALHDKATSAVSVDTALVNTYPDMLKTLDIPQALVTSPEGKFSCYVDSVTGKMGPSSYVEPKTMTVMPGTVEEFIEIFASY